MLQEKLVLTSKQELAPGKIGMKILHSPVEQHFVRTLTLAEILDLCCLLAFGSKHGPQNCS